MLDELANDEGPWRWFLHSLLLTKQWSLTKADSCPIEISASFGQIIMWPVYRVTPVQRKIVHPKNSYWSKKFHGFEDMTRKIAQHNFFLGISTLLGIFSYYKKCVSLFFSFSTTKLLPPYMHSSQRSLRPSRVASPVFDLGRRCRRGSRRSSSH